MILSVLGIALQYTADSSQDVKINGYKFTQYQGGWITYINDKQILIPTQPDLLSFQQTPDITFADLNKASKIYFSSNPNNQLPQNALFSIQNNIFPYLNNVVVACTEDSEACANLPLKTCKDATAGAIVIQAQLSNNSITSFNNNCLLVEGPTGLITQQVDALVLQLYGIK